MIALGIIATVLNVGVLGFLIGYVIYYLKKHKVKKGEEFSIPWKTYRFLILLVALCGLGNVAQVYGFAAFLEAKLTVAEHLFTIFGGLVFGSSFAVLFITFVLNMWRDTQVDKERKWVRLALFISIPVTIISFFLASEGVANHLTYPLWNNFEFGKGFVNFLTAGGNFKIAFYGVVIVGGAFISYWVCDTYFLKKYGKRGLIDTLFLVAFPMGLVGARLWFCFVLEPDYYFANPGEIITGVTKGGLAIQGGALLGAVSGIIFMLIFRKYVDIRFAIDVCVPTILIAQAIGRWGNYFNCEVHGVAQAVESWRFLPSVIVNQMMYSSADKATTFIGPDNMYVPLFLIESFINMSGYFVIRFAFKPLRKWLPLGFQGGMYAVWYGLTRIVLEPFRFGYNGSSETGGFGYSQSLVTAWVMVGAGLLIIGGFYLWGYLEKKYGKKHEFPTFNLD